MLAGFGAGPEGASGPFRENACSDSLWTFEWPSRNPPIIACSSQARSLCATVAFGSFAMRLRAMTRARGWRLPSMLGSGLGINGFSVAQILSSSCGRYADNCATRHRTDIGLRNVLPSFYPTFKRLESEDEHQMWIPYNPYNDKNRGIVAGLAGLVTLIFAIYSVCSFSAVAHERQIVLMAVWGMWPPFWFILEHYVLFDNWEDKLATKRFQDGQSSGQNFGQVLAHSLSSCSKTK
jgi:hypothetical protein